jgi:hypothetical protein
MFNIYCADDDTTDTVRDSLCRSNKAAGLVVLFASAWSGMARLVSGCLAAYSRSLLVRSALLSLAQLHGEAR